jgi:glycine cleavage system H protein
MVKKPTARIFPKVSRRCVSALKSPEVPPVFLGLQKPHQLGFRIALHIGLRPKPPSESMAQHIIPPGRSGQPSLAEALGTVPAESQACVWMRAKVLAYRLCDRDFDCEHCPLDAALHGSAVRASTPRADPQAEPNISRLFPQDRRFSPSHTWVFEQTSSTVRIGLDALVAWLVAEATGLELPSVGAEVELGAPLAALSLGGETLSIPAPVAGRVTACNSTALTCPQLVMAAPFRAGWLVDLALDPSRRDEQTSRLLCGPDMERLSRAHMHRFYRRMDTMLASPHSRVGSTMADGGMLLADPRTILGLPRYLALVQELLA